MWLITLHSLALPRPATAWSLLRDPLVVDLPPAPHSSLKFQGDCGLLQLWAAWRPWPLSFLLFVYARLGFFEVTVIHHEDVGGHHGFHFLSSGLSKYQISCPLLGCVKWRDAFGLGTVLSVCESLFGLGVVLCVCESLCLEVIFISAVNCKAT